MGKKDKEDKSAKEEKKKEKKEKKDKKDDDSDEKKDKNEKKKEKHLKQERGPPPPVSGGNDPLSKAEKLFRKGVFKPKEKVKVTLYEAPEAPHPSEDARLLQDVEKGDDDDLKTACKKLFKMLNLDPWNEASRYDDD